MKKSLSLMLIFVMLASLIAVMPVSAEVSRTVWDFADYVDDASVDTEVFNEGTNNSPKKSENWKVMRASADITIGNYIQTEYAGTWPQFYWIPGETSLEDGQKMELEFDLKAEMTTNKDLQFRFNGAAHYRIIIKTNGTLKRRIGDSSSQELSIPLISDETLSCPAGQGWNRYKIVFEATNAQLSDAESTHKAIKLTGFYLNGVNQIDTTADSYQSLDPAENGCLWAAFTGNTTDGFTYSGADARQFDSLFLNLSGQSGGMNEVLSFDNMSLTTYASTDTAPVDRGALVKAIRTAQTEYAEAAETYGASSEYATAMKNEISKAWTLCNAADATQTKFDNASSSLAQWSLGSNTPDIIWDDTSNTSPKATTAYTLLEGTPALTRDTTTFTSDITLTNVLKVEKSSSGTNYPRAGIQFASADSIQVGSAALSTYGRNAFAELEYDLNISNLKNDVEGGNGSYVTFTTYLMDSTTKARGVSLKIESNGAMKLNYHEKTTTYQTADLANQGFDHTRTNRIKLVIQLTDAQGNATQRVVGLHLNNGENLIDTPVDFMNLNADGVAVSPSSFNRVGFYPAGVGKCTNPIYYIDNERISIYNKGNINDPSPTELLNDSKLVVAIRTKYAEEAKVAADDKYVEVRDEVESSLAALETYYTDGTGTLTALLAEAERVSALIAALDTPEIVSVTYADAEDTAANGLTSNGKITGVTLKTYAEYSYSGVVLVGLYNGTTKELEGVSLAKNALSGKDIGEFTLTFTKPIEVPASIEGLYVKAMLWDDLTEMNAIDMLE